MEVEKGGVAIYRPFGEFRRANSYCSPVRWVRPTTGVLLVPCNEEFRGPRSDYVRQKMEIFRKITYLCSRTFQSRFNELDDVVKNLLWPAQSSDLNVIETLWSIFESSIRNRYLPLASPPQLLQYLHEECYNSHLNKVLEFHELIPM
ncbi:hypothetical protein TNCV_3720751 [Trichonephila clavipes]|nr:hypothetical protein TNCV_3720751 [Trichonephila clavipes]